MIRLTMSLGSKETLTTRELLGELLPQAFLERLEGGGAGP